MIAKVDFLSLLNTDPLAQYALIGLAATLLVTLCIFGFVMTRKTKRDASR
ncbi:MAG: hypothetical protein KDJ36_05255 [Hyphomicrobiaceae bacterium]|nr:hypothetical protein [Hyphomicrobiaceae bacterium]